jgi:hypothetical protein
MRLIQQDLLQEIDPLDAYDVAVDGDDVLFLKSFQHDRHPLPRRSDHGGDLVVGHLAGDDDRSSVSQRYSPRHRKILVCAFSNRIRVLLLQLRPPAVLKAIYSSGVGLDSSGT